MMKYILKSSIFGFTSFMILACGSSTTGQTVSSGISSSLLKSTMTENQKEMSMNFLLTNNYASKIKVEIKDLVLNIAPCEVSSSSISPQNFTFEKSANVRVKADIRLQGQCTPSSYQLEATTLLTLDGQTREVSLDSKVQEFNTTVASEIPSGYELSVIAKDDVVGLGIPNIRKSFSINLKDINGTLLNNDFQVTKIEVISENTLIVQLVDNLTDELKNSILLENENDVSFTVSSKKFSGLAPIRVNVEFLDSNKKIEKISTLVNIPVKSGPPSAISISYVSTGQDVERAKYIEKFAVSVTDEYGNKVNTRPYISLGAIVGYTVDGSESLGIEKSGTRRLFYGQFDVENGSANGTVNPLGDEIANTTNFEDTTPSRSNVFRWVNAEGKNSDKLVVFGKGKNYEAMGKWDFSKIDNNTLKLEDDYHGKFRGNLSYAIGRNYYQDQCTDDSREWVGTTDSDTYQLDEEGTVIVSYKYDYQLMGKDALVWVNLTGYQPDTEKNTRLGEVTKHTLLGQGLRLIGGTITLDANETTPKSRTYEIWHEGAENVPYRNAHFGWRASESSDCEIVDIKSSNQVDARVCNNGYSFEGRGYVTVTVRATEDKGCTFSMEDILVADEF